MTPKRAPNASQQTWIRFEKQKRQSHAVYVQARSGYFTYCGKFTRKEAVTHYWFPAADPNSTGPEFQCSACNTRLRCPYLVPDKLARIRDEVKA